LEEHHGHPRQIQEVSIDMSPAYIAGVNENIGSQAKVVFDKFHVVATASKAVDETRRAEARQSASAHNVLKESRWVWLKNPENLTDKQKITFRGLEKENLATARAYQMRLNLTEIY
jgi:transposase